MYVNWDDESIRLTGRWDRRNINAAVTTNPGGIIEAAFSGQMAILHFDTKGNRQPNPHLWIQVDGGARFEVTLEPYIHIQCLDNPKKQHVIKAVLKSSVEKKNRWAAPLVTKLGFKGIEALGKGVLEADNREIIEFVGDSITEGIETDADCGITKERTLVYQNDACATYAWLTSEILNLRPRIMGYGAVGVTKPGNGGVPKASDAYPCVYDGCALKEEQPSYIVINHGANDMRSTPDNYFKGYMELLKVVRKMNPSSKIFCLSAFYVVYPDTLKRVVNEFNNLYNDAVVFIDSAGWVPREPLHPTRDGHRIIACKLAEQICKHM